MVSVYHVSPGGAMRGGKESAAVRNIPAAAQKTGTSTLVHFSPSRRSIHLATGGPHKTEPMAGPSASTAFGGHFPNTWSRSFPAPFWIQHKIIPAKGKGFRESLMIPKKHLLKI